MGLKTATAAAGYAAVVPHKSVADIRRDAFLADAKNKLEKAQRVWAKKRRQLGQPDATEVEDAVIL